MFEQIHELIAALSSAGALRNPSIVSALVTFAAAFNDDDYEATMLGDIAFALVREGNYEGAEETARRMRGLEKSEYLRRLGELEAESGEIPRGLRTLTEARASALAEKQAQSITDIGRTFEKLDKNLAIDTWKLAVEVAMPDQSSQSQAAKFFIIIKLWKRLSASFLSAD